MKFGLENISRLCAALGDPQNAFRSIIVAGTNGKGSVTAMVETALRAAGHRTARYTSPHLERVEERFVVDGCETSTASLREAAARVREAAERVQRDGTPGAPPTFFECATAIAFDLFRSAHVDLAVLEVGLGGRLDATNVVTPIAAAITSIDFDHQAQLGDTLESIAFEKAGVIKPGIPVVCGPLPESALRVVERVCAERGARLLPVDARALAAVDALAAGRPLALPGVHQRVNAAVAVLLLETVRGLGVSIAPEAIRRGLCDVQWPARLERFRHRGTDVLLDAAHNPAGAQALAVYLRGVGWTDAALVLGVMRDKQVDAIVAALAPVCSLLVCTTARSPRAMAAAQIAETARRVAPAAAIEAVADPVAALERACRLRPRVVAAGSIFLVGPLRGILRGG